MYHDFEVTVKGTAVLIRSIKAYGETRAAARKSALVTYHRQYDVSCVVLAK